MWVVQEFMLARDVQLIAANVVIPLERFHTALKSFNDLAYNRRLDFRKTREEWLIALFSAAARIYQMFSLREKRLSQGRSGCNENDISLASCIVYLATERLYEDPRDRIYAMLALANDGLGIQPDYTLSAPAISNGFAIRSLLKGELMVLHASGIRPDTTAGTSSWAPNLSIRYFITLPLNAHELAFAASTHFPVGTKAVDEHTISISEVRVDAITATCNDQQIPEMELSHDTNIIWFHHRVGGYKSLQRWTGDIIASKTSPYKTNSWVDNMRWLMMLKAESPIPTPVSGQSLRLPNSTGLPRYRTLVDETGRPNRHLRWRRHSFHSTKNGHPGGGKL